MQNTLKNKKRVLLRIQKNFKKRFLQLWYTHIKLTRVHTRVHFWKPAITCPRVYDEFAVATAVVTGI